MSTDAERLAAWADVYAAADPLSAVYEELVIERAAHPDRFRILGAWKTGCLVPQQKEGEDGGSDPGDGSVGGAAASRASLAYKDKKGQQYFYTTDWNQKAPVGYAVWNTIADKESTIASLVPRNFTDYPPKLVLELARQPKFNFEMAVFVLHSLQPVMFPLYDEHVYRAFKYLVSGRYTDLGSLPSDWSEYGSYRRFFEEAVRATGLTPAVTTKGMEMLGRSLGEEQQQ